MKRKLSATLLMAAMLLPGAGQAQVASGDDADKAVAVVNGQAVLRRQIDDVIRRTNQPDTPEVRKAVQQRLVLRTVLGQAAEKDGYGTKPGVLQTVQEARVDAEIAAYLRDKVQPKPVTDAEVRSFYDDRVAQLGADEFKPAIIVVADADAAGKVLSELKSGKAFDSVAKERSLAPSRVNGGALPWVSYKIPATEGRTAGLPLAVAQALAQLAPGRVSDKPVQVDSGFAVVKLEARRPTKIPPFDEAKASVREQLQQMAQDRAMQSVVENLMKNAVIQ